MNKILLKKSALLASFTLLFSACKYQNEFQGTWNGQTATLSAYSKNVDKFCVSLTLTSGSEVRKNAIRAGEVYDSGDFTRTKTFNTKGTACAGEFNEYLTGSRSTRILSTRPVSRMENRGIDFCQVVYYNEYLYQDDLRFEVKKASDDSVVGTFNGSGETESYVDYSRPAGYGPIFFCDNGFPRPGFPYPFPRNYPFPVYPY
jgi:hypothetical protein